MNRLVTLLGLVLFLFANVAVSQQEDVDAESIDMSYSWFENYVDLSEHAFECIEAGLDEDISPEERKHIQKLCDTWMALLNSEAEKKIALSQHTVDVYHRQGIATNIILVLVVLVVISGLAMASYQLRVAVKSGGPQSNSELEASASKVRITSSSVGVVVLTISLLFLYLYVQEIYHINIISSP